MRVSKHFVSGAAVLGLVGASAAFAPGALAGKPPAPTISVVQFSPSGTQLTATEGQPGALQIVVIRANSTGTATFNLTPFDGTANIGSDYVPLWSNPLTIGPGATTRTVSMQIVNDTIAEKTESMTLLLTSAAADTQIGKKNSATVTIADNDPCPAVSVNDASAAEGTPPGSGNAITFTVSTAGAATCALPIQVHWATAATSSGGGLDATPGTDYVTASGNVAIPAGATSTTFNVMTVPDAIDEPNQTFNVLLSAPVNTSIADGTGLGTINDDDLAPYVTVDNNPTVVEGNTMSFTLKLSSVSELDASGTVDTWPGNTPDLRYTPSGDTAWSIPAGSTTTTFNVVTTDNNVPEADAVVWSHILTATNARIQTFGCSGVDFDCTNLGTDDAWGYGTLQDNDNGGFETGATSGWSLYQDGNADNPVVSNLSSNSGSFSAFLGGNTGCACAEPSGSSAIYRNFTVPASGTTTLSFWVNEQGDQNGVDGQFAQVKDANTFAVLDTIFDDGSANSTGTWLHKTYTFPAGLAGQTVQLIWVDYQDGAGAPTTMYLDDVQLSHTP